MSVITDPVVPLTNNDRFFIGGEWVKPSSDAVLDVIDSATEQLYFQVPEAQPRDMDLAIGAARQAFDGGPWPRMTHAERAGFLRAMADKLETRAADYTTMWPRESGVVHAVAKAGQSGYPETLRFYADLADDYPFEEPFAPSTASLAGGGYGLLVREPVGVVGAIIPWNAPLPLILIKVAPALVAGCTVIVKLSPEAPGGGYLMAEIAAEVGLPPVYSTCSPRTARCPSSWCVTTAWTRSPSRDRQRPAVESVRYAASESPAARLNWAVNRPP